MNDFHGLSGTKLHKVWRNMRRRCQSKNAHNYESYGGRGISICEEWENFLNFYEWSNKNGYEAGLSIDRIDNHGGYNPSNCRWANAKTQAGNTRRTMNITFNGKTQCLRDWAKELGISRPALRVRLRKMTVEEAFTKKLDRSKFKKLTVGQCLEIIHMKNQAIPLRSIMKSFNISRTTYYRVINLLYPNPIMEL